MDNEILKIRNVSKKFTDKEVLHNLNLTINRGQILALIGPNGSGKTTLIRTLLNLYNDNTGDITILDKDVKHKYSDVGRYVGVMIEESGVYELLTAKEYLEFVLDMVSNSSKQEKNDKVVETLKAVNLYNKRNEKIKTYSKGMIQRLAFARAIINNPKLLVLDEPFDGIDIETKINLVNIIKNRKDNMAILITSHNLKEIEELCDNIAVIKQGNILFNDTIECFRSKYNVYSNLKIVFDSSCNVKEINTVLPMAIYNPKEKAFQFSIKAKNEKELIFDKIQKSNLKIKDMFEEKVNLEEIYLNVINNG